MLSSRFLEIYSLSFFLFVFFLNGLSLKKTLECLRYSTTEK